jgi:thymidylate synthase (FAD)
MDIVLDLKEEFVGNNGFVKLVDILPRVLSSDQLDLKCDSAIVQAARISYSSGTTTKNSDKALVKYLLKNAHTTPFEMVQFKFHIKAPIFVIRQWQRHRMSSYNELSARYSLIEDSFWIPEKLRTQSDLNKQGSDGNLDNDTELIEMMEKHQKDSYDLYQKLLDEGVCREMARTVLPLSINSEFYWKIDLHNLLRFIGLRNDEHAQFEIRQYANAIKKIVTEYCPITMEAFEEYISESIKFSKTEIECLNKNKLPSGSKSSLAEFNDKIDRIAPLKNSYKD